MDRVLRSSVVNVVDWSSSFSSPFLARRLHAVLAFLLIVAAVNARHAAAYLQMPSPSQPTVAPQFDMSVTSNVTIIAGNTALLHCRVHHLSNQTVVWVRHRDIHLLTVNQITYTSDERFDCQHDADNDIWSLQLRNVSVRDTGVYECQVGTTPAIGIPVHLAVVQPITTILGGPDAYINAESTINLTCIVHNLPVPPSFVQWTHNHKEVNFDSERGGVSVITEKGDITTSYLYIQRARPGDEGIYRCSPSNANNVSVRVHIVLDEQSAAAVQMISSGPHRICHRLGVVLLVLLVLVMDANLSH